MKNNKTFIIGSIIAIILVSSFSFFADNLKKSGSGEDILEIAIKESSEISSSQKKEFSKIGVDDYLDFYNGSKDTLILVGRDGCQYCQIAEPIIQNIMFLYNLDIKYLSTDDFDVISEEKFMTSDERLASFATPLLMNVSNSTIKGMQSGLTNKTGYISFLQNNNFINK